jgi:hypothetical protein
MALSNIWKEPRREITETVVGFGAVVAGLGIPLYGGYWVARWAAGPAAPFSQVLGYGFCLTMAGGLVCGMLLSLAFVIHEVGDEVCTTLEEHGIRLRPKRRY